MTKRTRTEQHWRNEEPDGGYEFIVKVNADLIKRAMRTVPEYVNEWTNDGKTVTTVELVFGWLYTEANGIKNVWVYNEPAPDPMFADDEPVDPWDCFIDDMNWLRRAEKAA